MNYYERYCGDYGRDTGHLSLAQHGAYTLMLDHYYATEKPLPASHALLYRICRSQTKAEQEAVRSVADEFFPVGDDGLRHNRRADEEIAEAKPRIAASRVNGKHGGRPKKNLEETHRKPTGLPVDNPPETRSGDPHTPSPKENLPDASASGAPGDAGTRLPDCPQVRIVEAYHDLLPMCPRVVDWTPARQASLRSRWREKAMPNGSGKGYRSEDEGLAYWRRFFGYVAESKFLTGRAEGRDGKPPFVADLEWLLKPSKFAKVIEGSYHR